MEIRKLDEKEVSEAFRNRKKFKSIVIEALEYSLSKREDSNVFLIQVKEVSQVVKEMLNLKGSEYDRRINVKIGLTLNDLGIKTFNTARGKEFVITKTQFETIKNANKK